MIAGLEEISKGDVFIGDRRVNDVPPKDRDIAMVFRDYAPYPHMTVSRQPRLRFETAKISDAEIKKRVLGRGRDSRTRGAAGAQTEIAFRRTTPAGRGRSCDRSSAESISLRRAARESRRQDARANANEITKLHQRLQATMIYVTHDPDRGDGDGRPDRCHERRRHATRRDARCRFTTSRQMSFVAGFLAARR